ncbi:MAG: MinD/ParA family protein [Eubacterium sp.]|nr:MinD/ParA family protein [Eubacterium sp.]MCI8918936.1 MinD/ParA family protein [Eubacterium sp.]
MDQAEQLRNVIKSKQARSVSKARVITITSGKGGVGKSNIAVNLAVQLRRLGKKVIIFDADMGLANVEVMFGAIPKYNLSDMIYHGKKMRDIITEGPMEIGFISGGNGITGMNNLTKNQLTRLVNNLIELDELTDFILIDTGAGIANNVMEFVSASPEVLLVLTPEPSSLTDSYSLIKALYGNPGFIRHSTKIEVVVNRTVSPEDGQIVYDKLSSVISKFLQGEVQFFGTIPQDILLEKSVRAQKIVSLSAPNARSARAFESLAQSLIDGEPMMEEERLGIRELFFSFFK